MKSHRAPTDCTQTDCLNTLVHAQDLIIDCSCNCYCGAKWSP